MFIARKKPRWQAQGKEPDYRFSLANERTFLAWIRTALALIAGAVILDQVAIRYPNQKLLSAMTLLSSLVAALLSFYAYKRWKANEIAMRHEEPLPTSWFIAGVAVGILIVAVVVTIALLHKL